MKADGKRRLLALAAAVGLLLGLGPLAVHADDDEEDDGKELVRLEVQVMSEEDEEPIPNASVYIKFKEERFLWRDKKHQWSVKTDQKGKVIVPVPLPEGRVLVQVVAKGWKTYGRYHELEGPKHVIKVKLKEPKRWY